MLIGTGRGEKPGCEAPSDHVATTALHELVSIRAAKYRDTFVRKKWCIQYWAQDIPEAEASRVGRRLGALCHPTSASAPLSSLTPRALWLTDGEERPGLIHEGLAQYGCAGQNRQRVHQSLERQSLGKTPLRAELWVVRFDQDALFDQTLVRFLWRWVGLNLGHVPELSFSKSPAKSV